MRSTATFVMTFIATTMLSSCGPTIENVNWKQGTTPDQRASDETNCAVAASQQVPSAMAVAQTPVYTTPTYASPTYTSCYGYGYGASCTTTGGQISGGQTYGGQVYSYDANSQLRQRVVAQCMAQKGYANYSFPTCTAEDVKAGTPFGAGSPMPRPQQVLCVSTNGAFVVKP